MSKIYSEERWDEDDACVECGDDLLGNESKVPGICTVCFGELNKGPLISKPTFGKPSVQVMPKE